MLIAMPDYRCTSGIAAKLLFLVALTCLAYVICTNCVATLYQDENQVIYPNNFRQILENDSNYIVAYVSNVPPENSNYIEYSILLPSKSFLGQNKKLRPINELAAIFGSAGISENDSVVLYGDCFSCGDPTFVFWIMRYLGHENVKLLTGTTADWTTAGIPMQKKTYTRQAIKYNANPDLELLADYDHVKNGDLHILDARDSATFAKGHINSAINLPYSQVISNDWLKEQMALEKVFSGLDKDKTILVYTKRGGQASIVWFALQLQGYDACLYFWEDWMAHQ